MAAYVLVRVCGWDVGGLVGGLHILAILDVSKFKSLMGG